MIIGHFYRMRQDFAKAASYYQRAAELSTTQVIAYYSLAELKAQSGDRREAIAYLRTAIEINPAFTKSYRALGALYEQELDHRGAQRVYESGLQVAPDDPILLNNLAWVTLMQGGDVSTAYLHIRKAVALAPGDPDVQDTLAWWYYLTHDYQEAIHILKKVIRAQPDQALYHYHLGMAYLNVGDREQAWQHLQRALDLGIDAEHRSRIMEQRP
jgi:Flp pilus assembly protein TadD